MNPTPAPYRLLGFDVSYFTGKVRPAFRYKQLWVSEERADMAELQRRTGLTFIPVVVTPDDETWQDSSEILERLEERHPEPPLFPTTPVQRIAALLVELYVDEFGVTPAMHTRWGSELGEATARARFSAMIGNTTVGNLAADRMVKARYLLGATEATGPALEAHVRELFEAESAHFDEHAYLLGERMSFADCALMGQQYGHFFVDLVSRRQLLETAIPVVGWIERCNAPNPDAQGEWLANDAIAPSLHAVLGAMGRDAAPVILDLVAAAEAWADDRPADLEEPPRGLGTCSCRLRGVEFERGVLAYVLWSVARVVDAYTALAADEAALDGTGWEPLLAHRPRHRLVRRDFALVFEP